MADRGAVEEVLSRYFCSHDAKQWEELAGCLLPDTGYELVVAASEESFTHRGARAIIDQIKDFKQRYSEKRHHLITNFRYDDESDDRCVVRSYVTVLHFGQDGISIVTAGECRDEVVLRDGGWRIADKQMRLERAF
jgi:3-phenylpropionate/cinnamic acid dioxygenase small subunit